MRLYPHPPSAQSALFVSKSWHADTLSALGQKTENLRVGSSILPLPTFFSLDIRSRYASRGRPAFPLTPSPQSLSLDLGEGRVRAPLSKSTPGADKRKRGGGDSRDGGAASFTNSSAPR